MKILHVFDHSLPLQDGYSSRSWAILQQQKKMGWEVLPVTGPKQGSGDDNDELVGDIRFYRTAGRTSFWERLPLAKQFWVIYLMYLRVIAVAQRLKPDVIHAHSPALNGVAAYFAAKKMGLPLVYEVRAFWEDAAVDQGTSSEGGFRYRMTRALENFVFKRASRVTAICEGLKNDIDARGLCQKPVIVIPNAVEFERFSTLTARDESLGMKYGLTEGETLGFVGSFYDYEGLDEMITAMPKLVERNPRVKLVLVGGGVQDKALRALSERLGMASHVIFVGRVPFSEVEKLYSIIDVLVYPRKSLRLTELVTPLKPLEAMAQEKVFVASNVGGHRELVIDGETGILFKADDIDALVVAVESLMKDKALQEKLKRNGLDFVRDERNWTNSVARYTAVYEGAVAQGRVC